MVDLRIIQNLNPVSEYGLDVLEKYFGKPGVGFNMIGDIKNNPVNKFMMRGNSPLVYGGQNIPLRNPMVPVGNTLPNNIIINSNVPSAQPRAINANVANDIKLLTTSGKPIVDPTLGKGIPVDKWAAGGYGYRNPKLGPTVKPETVINLGTSKKAATPLITKQGLKTTATMLPLVGDVYDIGRGTYQALHGHPIAGTMQAGLGTAGLLTLGTASLLKSGGKAAIKGAVKKGIIDKAIAKDLLSGNLKNIKNAERLSKLLNNKYVASAGAIVPEIAYALFGDEDLSKSEAKEVSDTENSIRKGDANTSNKQSTTGRVGSSTVLRDANGNVILPGLPGTSLVGDLPDISTATGNTASGLSEDSIEDINAQSGISTSSDLDKLLEAYERRLSVNQPYMNALWQYMQNYPEMQRAAMNRDKWLTGVSILSGSPEFKNMIGKYNPADIEATRLDLLNKLLQTKANELSGMDELIGRAALTKTGNLPIEAALADKDTFKAMSPILSSINALKGRTYATDINNQTKLQVAKMKLESDMAIAKANRDVRAQIAIGNQLATINRALITSMGFNGVSPAGLADVYNQMGYGTLDTSNLQGVDLQSAMNNLGL